MARLYPPVTVRLVAAPPREALRLVAAAARVTVSRKSLEEALEGLDEGVWLRELLARGHGSPLEHVSFTFEATCSRVCSHQLVRHRIASYTQQSMRVTDAMLRRTVLELCGLVGRACPSRPRGPGDYEAYASAVEAALDALGGGRMVDGIVYAVSIGFSLNPFRPLRVLAAYASSLLRGLADYYRLLAEGEPMEDARYVVASAVRTRIVFTMNARELAESFIPLRACTRAQWEVRLLAWMVWGLLADRYPELFAYTGPRCVLHDARSRAEGPCSLHGYVSGACRPSIERCPERVPRDAIPSCLAASYRLYRRYLEMFPEAASYNPLAGPGAPGGGVGARHPGGAGGGAGAGAAGVAAGEQ